MKKENTAYGSIVVPSGRITRAKAAACNASAEMLQIKPPLAKPNKRQAQLGKTKRDENNYAAPTAVSQFKKRAVLRDVTNICSNPLKGCVNATKLQAKASQKSKPDISKAKPCSEHPDSLPPGISVENVLILEKKKDEQILESRIFESQESVLSLDVKENSSVLPNHMDRDRSCITTQFEGRNFRERRDLVCHTKNAAIVNFCKDHGDFSDLDFIDIDSDHTNPQMCSLYSYEIYIHQRTAELLRRPYSNFMETVQKDINHSMRGILIDWLVEVSDEYRLVPDTLYLTVNFIDRYLSQTCIERQRLQLLGITCMLIASKYEEICAPPVEEFCSITDNTYTKTEVLEMEIHILRLLCFQLSVPTIKTFLRRFIRAANASYKVPPQALSHLANYLAELTLVDYSFLKFLPSVIAASSVFLARWTLEQSDHPWTETLVHYSSYKASELKPTIIALQELQMNTNNCTLNAIREKYKQPKFQSVAAMTSPELLQSLFC